MKILVIWGIKGGRNMRMKVIDATLPLRCKDGRRERTRIVTARLTFIMKDEPSELTAIEGELMRLTGADDVEIIKVQDFINDEQPKDVRHDCERKTKQWRGC